ncbi:MAG: HvfB family MNIO-type RiPP peptide maturase [Oceanococcus sp.]
MSNLSANKSNILAAAPVNPVAAAGLGLRRDFLRQFLQQRPKNVDFLEVAPENWIGIGGRLGRQFAEAVADYPLYCHGLSLDIGGPRELDRNFIAQLKTFLDANKVVMYSEHLSACGDDGHMYDLMPIPFTEEAVKYVAARIRQVQDQLERTLIIENVSYYAAPGAQMREIDFLLAVLAEADCQLLLDVNNIVVNSINHAYDAVEFLQAIPVERIAYGHIAGHDYEAEDLRVDTHGQPVDSAVWDLLDTTYERFGVFPTLLERDFNIPAWSELMGEVDRIHHAQSRCAQSEQACA